MKYILGRNPYSFKSDGNDEDRGLSEIITKLLEKYIKKLKIEGLRNRISRAIPNKEIDSFILQNVKKYLMPKKILCMGKVLGIISVQYRRGGIQLEPSGVIRLLIKRITITDKQILSAVNNVIDQAQKKYIDDSGYIISKIKGIFLKLSETGIYKPETSEEKTIYDLAVLVLLDYYKSNEDKPGWVISAINNLKRGDFVEDWIDAILDHIYSVASEVSENLHFNFKMTFDSIFIRTMLNRNTNNGQISKLLSIMGIDIKKLIYSVADDYLSPSFIEGAGELLRDIVETFMYDFAINKKKLSINRKLPAKVKEIKKEQCIPRQITMTAGVDFLFQRAFRWYTDRRSILFIEISNDESFLDSIKIEADCRCVPCPRPIINLGVITSYSINKVFEYSAQVKDLKQNSQYYYRICDKNGNILSDIFSFLIENAPKEFEFVVLADSQGMIKDDYDLFLKVFNAAVQKCKHPSFVVNMGDFVDDGNNESYWEWILNSKLWAENVIIPLAGNHEAKNSCTANRAGVENSIIRHFNLVGLPEQSLSTGAYYSYTYGNALFIVLNTNNMDDKGNININQYLWAINEAKKSKLKWKILLTHKSPYSNGPHHDDVDVQCIGKQIIKLAYEAKFDLVIGGHDHVYVRTPMMSCGRCVGRTQRSVRKEGLIYDVYSNPFGTVFIVPGTSGVKNYKIDYSASFPTEIIGDLNCPVYSNVKVSEDKIFFTSYKYSAADNKSECIDCFAIEKKDKLKNMAVSSREVINSIACISNNPWDPSRDRINEAYLMFNNLTYEERLKVFNYQYLDNINRLDNNYDELINKKIEVVKSRKEFLRALNDHDVGTILVDCAEIKFENKLGFRNKVIINRNLCIRGSANLVLVKFVVKDGAMLILGDSICIDNSRRISSAYSSLDAVELKDNTCFIMLDYSSIKCNGGIGFKGRGINISGIGASAFLNTASGNYTSKEFIRSTYRDSNVFVYNGKYFSSKKRYAINTSGSIKIKGGKIRGLKMLPGSKGYINSGEIIGGDKKGLPIPIYCMGKMKIKGGNISSGTESTIVLRGEDSLLCIVPDHRGCVKINDKNVFIGDVRSIDNEIRINLSIESLREDYKDIKVYSFIDDMEFYDQGNLKEIKGDIKDGEIIKVSSKNNNIVIMGKIDNSIKRNGIIVKNGGQYYLFSKPFVIHEKTDNI